jgi:hypothetical protein
LELSFEVWSLRLKVCRSKWMAKTLPIGAVSRSRVQGAGFRVQGSGRRLYGVEHSIKI